MESGEGYDRASLSLLGKQQKLLEAIKATGKPMIVVYIQGRPLEMNWAAQNANALLCAWYPGQEGGNAIADVLTGDVNPSGKMPISVPKNVGQLPVYYNKKTPIGHEYVEMNQLPLYTFGYGLSYTTFQYSDLVINKKEKESFEISCKVKNTGKVAGKEVVQLYLRDEVVSVVQPVKQLKHFHKIMLKPGDEKTVTFDITSDDLSLVNINMQKVVEPGAFKVMLGASSADIRLEGKVVVE
jgi:beta-glucosidase